MSTATTSRVSSGAKSGEIGSIDLVVPTVGRSAELERFLRSVATQSWQGAVRVILVDQNPDDRLTPIVAACGSDVAITHLRSAPGVSVACSLGYRASTADVVGRADDDCWYPQDALERVGAAFGEDAGLDGLCGRTCDESGRSTQLRWAGEAGAVTRRNVFRRAIGATLFLRRAAVETLGDWDETYGPRVLEDGQIGGGSEDGEYILRALRTGLTLRFDPAVCVHHADFEPRWGDTEAMRKAYLYGLDHSRLLHDYGFSRAYASWRCAQLAAATLVYLAVRRPGRARFYAAMCGGRLLGMISPTRFTP